MPLSQGVTGARRVSAQGRAATHILILPQVRASFRGRLPSPIFHIWQWKTSLQGVSVATCLAHIRTWLSGSAPPAQLQPLAPLPEASLPSYLIPADAHPLHRFTLPPAGQAALGSHAVRCMGSMSQLCRRVGSPGKSLFCRGFAFSLLVRAKRTPCPGVSMQVLPLRPQPGVECGSAALQ